MKILVYFCGSCRGGCVESLFTCTEKELKDCIGKKVYFGEILGKHSDVYGYLDKSDFKIVSRNQTFIKEFEKLNINIGYNPLSYLIEEENEDIEEDEDLDL